MGVGILSPQAKKHHFCAALGCCAAYRNAVPSWSQGPKLHWVNGRAERGRSAVLPSSPSGNLNNILPPRVHVDGSHFIRVVSFGPLRRGFAVVPKPALIVAGFSIRAHLHGTWGRDTATFGYFIATTMILQMSESRWEA
ncbi:hypothetical protein B0T13DRAFT_448326 [Neurospora crassa]|nr:hypothetical protein B0T13DRAFT_448326 [Neurospora crassa]